MARKPQARPADVAPSQPDPLGEALIAHGLVPNEYILDLNRALTVPHDMELPAPWNLPSRMFTFPIEVSGNPRDGTPRRLGLIHPLLVDHPFVRHVRATLGIELDPDGAPNEHGWRPGGHAEWWHAVDLISAGRWKDLLETERFTTPDHIAGAVSYGLSYSPYEGKRRNGHISIMEARKILAHIGPPEPDDKPGLLRHFLRPSACEKRWPINQVSSGATDRKAWAHVIGIEEGWFAHDRSGFLGWTPMGRDKFTTVAAEFDRATADALPERKAPPVPPPVPTKGAAAKPMQLSLF